MDKKILYFLCTGNSCRSQIAEGFGKAILGEKFDVYSAGIEAHGLNPMAVDAMREVSIDISSQTSDLINLDILAKADYIITLCGDANDNCPVTPPHITRWHWGFDDPARATGSDVEIWTVFQRVRDEIKQRIISFSETVK